jgi:hypothetical protein
MGTARLVAAAISACVFAAAGSARAALLSVDDPFFGPGSITRDTATGLEWLDVPLSVNRTFAEVLDEFGPGGDFRGLRHATGEEITQLFEDADIPVIGNLTIGGQQQNYPVAIDLIDLVGATGSQATFPETRGFYDAASPGSIAVLDFLFVSHAPAYLVTVDGGFNNPELHWPHIGHWLVREVPEPSSWTLLAVGLLALWWRAAREKNRKENRSMASSPKATSRHGLRQRLIISDPSIESSPQLRPGVAGPGYELPFCSPKSRLPHSTLAK